MKLKIIAFMAFATSAHADLSYQMANAIGDWDFGKGKNVLRIQKQSDRAIKVYTCDRQGWLNTQNCSYSSIVIYTYDSELDGFCENGRQYCVTGFQVSFQYNSEILNSIDPKGVYDLSNTGYAVEGRK